MHNNTAVVLSLFNAERSIETIIEMVKVMFKMDYKRAAVYAESVVHRFNPFFVNETNPMENPNCLLDSSIFVCDYNEYKLPAKYPAPVVISMNTTFHCNRKCIYCYMNAKHDVVVEEDCVSNERLRAITNEAERFSGKKIIIEINMDLSKEALSALNDINSTVVFHIPLMIEPAEYRILKQVLKRYKYNFTYCFYAAKKFISTKGNDEIDSIFRNPRANVDILKLKVNCGAGKYSVFVTVQGTVYCSNIDTNSKCRTCNVRYFCADTCENKSITGFSISCEFMKRLVEQNI